MPILCVCPNGHALRVKDKLAGRLGKCPTCGADFQVPALPAAPAEGGPPPVASSPNDAPAEGAVEWRMARPGGEQYGPTVPTVFAQWIAAGRVTPDTLVWRTGWPDWRRADAADAELPAPLPEAGQASQEPAPGVTLPPPLPPAEASPTEPAPPVEKPNVGKPTATTGAYSVRRRQQAKRRRLFTISLALICLVLGGLLVALMLSGPPSGAPVLPP